MSEVPLYSKRRNRKPESLETRTLEHPHLETGYLKFEASSRKHSHCIARSAPSILRAPAPSEPRRRHPRFETRITRNHPNPDT